MSILASKASNNGIGVSVVGVGIGVIIGIEIGVAVRVVGFDVGVGVAVGTGVGVEVEIGVGGSGVGIESKSVLTLACTVASISGDSGVASDEHARRESIMKELINKKIIFFLVLNIRVNLFQGIIHFIIKQ